MSNNSFDDVISARPEFTSANNQDNAITINSLTAEDFRDYNNFSRRTDPISSRIDAFTGDDVPGVKIKGRGGIFARPDDLIGIIDINPAFEMTPKPNFLSDDYFGTSDRPIRYPLPMEAVTLTGESALQQLNQRIVDQAVKKVQDSMTPQEKQQLNKDADKYAEAMREYEKEMRQAEMQRFMRRPEDWPKPPAKPQSLIKYEEAVDKEIERLVKRASV